MDAREDSLGPCEVAAAYTAVVDTARSEYVACKTSKRHGGIALADAVAMARTLISLTLFCGCARVPVVTCALRHLCLQTSPWCQRKGQDDTRRWWQSNQHLPWTLGRSAASTTSNVLCATPTMKSSSLRKCGACVFSTEPRGWYGMDSYVTAGLTDLVFPLGKLHQSVTNRLPIGACMHCTARALRSCHHHVCLANRCLGQKKNQHAV